VRPREDASEMPIRAQKTDALVPVQIHSEYRRIIEAGKPAQLEQFSTFRLSTAVVENTQEMALCGPINCAPIGTFAAWSGMQAAQSSLEY